MTVNMNANGKLITQAEYARKRGVQKSAVHKAVQTGRITLINGKIDPEVADIQWAKNTNASQQRNQFAQSSLVVVPGDDPVDPIAGIFNLATARAKREHFDAELSEMRARKESGELVAANEITAAITAAAAMIRSALERMPDKLADRLAAETSALTIHALMQTEIDQVLDDMTFAVLELRGDDAEVIHG